MSRRKIISFAVPPVMFGIIALGTLPVLPLGRGERSESEEVATLSSSDKSAPAVSDIVVQPGAVSARVTWQSDEPAKSVIYYSRGASAVKGASETESQRSERELMHHSIILTNLDPLSNYALIIESIDKSGNVSMSESFTFKTVAPLWLN